MSIQEYLTTLNPKDKARRMLQSGSKLIQTGISMVPDQCYRWGIRVQKWTRAFTFPVGWLIRRLCFLSARGLAVAGVCCCCCCCAAHGCRDSSPAAAWPVAAPEMRLISPALVSYRRPTQRFHFSTSTGQDNFILASSPRQGMGSTWHTGAMGKQSVENVIFQCFILL